MMSYEERLEQELASKDPDIINATPKSPEYGFSMNRMAKLGGLKLPKTFWGKIRFMLEIAPKMARAKLISFVSLKRMFQRRAAVRTSCSANELRRIHDKARSLGADLVGYTKLDPDYIFQGKGVQYPNVIVLAMEMEKEAISKAPHFDAEKEVQRVYADLGGVAFKLGEFLKRAGFGAQASPALGGFAVYPPIAESAGLGWIGKNGLLLTPEFGPRQRLALVFTSIDNLPFKSLEENEHQWMRDFCNICHACVRQCPPKAIFRKAQRNPTGSLTHVDDNKCFPYFAANDGCGVCMKVCPFHSHDTKMLKRSLRKYQDKTNARSQKR